MIEKRKSTRFSLERSLDPTVEVELMEATDRRIVVISPLPLVRHRDYLLTSDGDDVRVEGRVLWSRQTTATPRYEVGLRALPTSAADDLAEQFRDHRSFRLRPAHGGLPGRIPWHTDFLRTAPPDRAFVALEVGLGGMLMVTAERDAPGDPFAVEFPVGSGSFRCLGRIVRTEPDAGTTSSFRHGVEFLDVENDELELLRAWLDSI